MHPKHRGGMGIWDLHAFNLAMLAKQAWRLLHNTRSLFYKVYKVRYFLDWSFMEAELGNNPSFVQCSLLVARALIHAGSRWQIRDGRKVGGATHFWLPNTPVFLNALAMGMKVNDLIDRDTRQQDRGKLFATFDCRTSEEILALPLNQLNSPDQLLWKENRSQKFQVQSAYQVALRLKNPHPAEYSFVQSHGSMWGKIWKLNVLLKVCYFIWRGCSNCLPTQANLHKKRVSVEPNCEFCHQEPKTTCHLLCECPFAWNVWALFKGRTQKCRNEAIDFFLLFKQMQQKLSNLEKRDGQPRHEQSGMQEIDFILRKSESI